jgi:6-phosphogluconolactonase (cycloisomerase 2 family)
MQRAVLAGILVTFLAALAGAAPAPARHGAPPGHGPGHGYGHHGHHGHHAVFVQTNDPTGNAIAVYDRAGDGTLTRVGTYATGGLGGIASPGTESDHLASQGSLALTRGHHLLIAVNAGSDTISVFRVHHDQLQLMQVLASGGQFPASIGVARNLVYVLNSGGTGIVQGFRIHGQGLTPISGSARSLGLANGNPPDFLTAPGQVGFTPDGRKLLVTTKLSGSLIDVFLVGHDGRLSSTPVANPSATPVPFAFTFGPAGRLVSGEAGTSSVTTYSIEAAGTLTNPQSASDGQMALCWIQRVGRFFFVSNTASNNLSSFWITSSGQPMLLQAVAASTDPGPIDLAASGHFLYAETGTNGTVDEFRVGNDGTLVPLGSVTDLPPGIEGIAAD